MNKTLLAAVTAMSLAIAAAGCGSSQHSSSTGAAGGAVSTSSSAAALAPSSTSSATSSSSGAAATGSTGSGSIDYRTVDPCSLISQQALNSFAPHSSSRVIHTGYDSCALSVATKKKQWSIQIDMNNTSTSTAELGQVYRSKVHTASEHGATVYDGEGSGTCLRAFNLPQNGPTYVINVVSRRNKPCQAAEAGLGSAMSAASAGEAKPLSLPANSLARIDFCATFAKAAAALLGTSVAGRPSGEHGCQWSDGSNRTLLASLQTDVWPPSQLGGRAKVSTLAGRQVAEIVVPAKAGTFAQAAVKFGTPPASVSPGPGNFDFISVIAAERGAVAAGLPQKLQQFLTTVAGTQPG